MDILNLKGKTYKYNAFISYRHCEPDKTIAAKLHTMLETYKTPKAIYKKTGIKKINRVFRDREELPTSSNLSNDIQDALINSKCLIIICSTNTPKSQWVTKEIKTFMELHGTENIIPLLIEGEPFESFPEPLLNAKKITIKEDGSEIQEDLEFMAADIRPEEMKKDKNKKYGLDSARDKSYLSEGLKELKVEKLRILANIVKCEFNDLRQRQLERKVKKIIMAAAIVSTMFAGFGTFAMYQYSVINNQNKVIDEKNKDLEKSNIEIKNQILLTEQQRNIAEKNETEASKQAKIAEENEKEAKKQANLAAQNAEEAMKNFNIAKQKEQEAIANLNEATKQKEIAILQRNTAYRNQSLFLSNLSNEEVKKGNKNMGIMLALEALPKDIISPEKPLVKNAELALKNAIYSYQPSFGNNSGYEYSSILKHEDVEGFSLNKDETRLYSFSEDTLKFWNIENGALIQEKLLCNKMEEKVGQIYESEKYILASCNSTNPLNRHVSTIFIINKELNNIDEIKKIQDVDSIFVSEKNKYAILKTLTKEVFVINLNTAKVTKTNIFSNIFNIYYYSHSLEFSEDGSLIAFFNKENKKVYIYDAINNSVSYSIDEENADKLYFNSNNELFYINKSDKGSNELIKTKGSKTEVLISSKTIYTYEIINEETILICYENEDGKTIISKINTNNKNKNEEDIGNAYDPAIVLSPNRLYFTVALSGEGTAKLYNMETMKKIADINQSNGDYFRDFCQVIFSPDSNFFITLSQNKKMKLWNTKTGGYISTIDEINPESVLNIKICSSHKIIFSDYKDGIYVINMSTPSKVKYFYSEFPWPNTSFNSLNNNYILVNAFDELKQYSLNENKFTNSTKGMLYDKSFFNFKKNISILVTNKDNNETPIINIDNKIKQINWNYGDIVNSNINSDGTNYLVAGKKDIVLFDRNNNETKHIKLQNVDDDIFGAFYMDSNKTIILYTPNKIMYYDGITGDFINEYKPNEFKTGDFSITKVKVSPDQSKFVCLYGNGKAEVFESSSRKLMFTLMQEGIGIFSISNEEALTCHDGYKLSVLSLKDGSKVTDLCTYIDNDVINDCDINYDGTKALASYGKSGYVFVWDLVYDTNSLIKYSNELLKGRTLTDEERKAYFLSE